MAIIFCLLVMKSCYKKHQGNILLHTNIFLFFFMGRPSPAALSTSGNALRTLHFVNIPSYRQCSCHSPNRRDGFCSVPYPTISRLRTLIFSFSCTGLFLFAWPNVGIWNALCILEYFKNSARVKCTCCARLCQNF